MLTKKILENSFFLFSLLFLKFKIDLILFISLVLFRSRGGNFTTTKNSEIKQIQLVIDRNDIMVKQFVAGIWQGINPFLGFSYSTSLPIDGCAAYIKGKISVPTSKTKTEDGFKIEVEFPNPIRSGEKYVYELQLLLNQNSIEKIGQLNIFFCARIFQQCHQRVLT